MSDAPTVVTRARRGRVALFRLDEAVTDWDEPAEFVAGAEETDQSRAGRLAGRLLGADLDVVYVYVSGSEVMVERAGDWADADLEAAVRAIREGHLAGEEPEAAEERYDAAIVEVREAHADLRVIRVSPDGDLPGFEPGQYTTLALGYWEPRVDGHPEDLAEARRERLARRSYSVSSSILNERGDLLDWRDEDWVEFYVVLVRGEGDPRDPPALTPRLFGKGQGARLHMSTRFKGHYTLEGVSDETDVVFLATGTGEAPHNLMTLELLLRGHRGRILSVCCVRYGQDLAYLATHRLLEEKVSDYRYVALTTREPPGTEKVYVQDLIRSGRLEQELGRPLDPDRTHVFVCGNPAMIGLPREREGELAFPEPEGVCEILVRRGFTLDENIHYEEYWKREP